MCNAATDAYLFPPFTPTCCVCAGSIPTFQPELIFDVPVNGKTTYTGNYHIGGAGSPAPYFQFNLGGGLPDAVWAFGGTFYAVESYAALSAFVAGGGPTATYSDMASYDCGGADFTVTYNITSANYADLYALGVRKATVKTLNGYPFCCPLTITVYGCGNVQSYNATVSLWTDSTKTTFLSSADSTLDGTCHLGMGTAPSTVYYEASIPGMVTVSGTLTLTQCYQSRGINVTVPASGYHCMDTSLGCDLPFPSLLHGTHSVFGNYTLNYATSGTYGAGWYGTIVYNYPGYDCMCKAGTTVTVTCFLKTDGTYQEYWKST